MSVSRLNHVVRFGVGSITQLAEQTIDASILRLDNLETDIGPADGVIAQTQQMIEADDANSYLPFLGSNQLRRTVTDRVSLSSGCDYDWKQSSIICAGGLNGVLDVLLAILEPGDEVVIPAPAYIGIVNRVRIAGGVPVFLPCVVKDGVWALDLDQLEGLITRKTRAFLMMSPNMPSGLVLTKHEWQYICRACVQSDSWMIYNSAMERILFDGLSVIHPASFKGMRERTITVGSASKEQRMIAWRIGWIVAPPAICGDIASIAVSNVISNGGMAQEAVHFSLLPENENLASIVTEWQRRRDVLLRELDGFPTIKPMGGWSLLMDVSSYNISATEAASVLFDKARVAVTAIKGWGGDADDRYIRLVFSKEPVRRLLGLRSRFTKAFKGISKSR